MTHLTDEHCKHEDAKQPVARHEHVFYLYRRHGVVADGRRRLRRQVHAVKVTEHASRHVLYTQYVSRPMLSR